MIDLVLAESDYEAIKAELCGGETEKCAVLLANQTSRPDGALRLLVYEIQWPSPSDYTRVGKLEAELAPDYVARVTKRAKRENRTLVFVHSHPGEHAPQFSRIDDAGEKHLAAFLERRHPGPGHAALVISAGGARARRLGKAEEIRIVSVGATLNIVFDPASTNGTLAEEFDRQIRAFGEEGQRKLEQLKVAIIGLGGTGAILAQELVHSGVRNFILVDPDVIEVTNLNRVPNAAASDVGKQKTEIAANYIQTIAKSAEIRRINDDVTETKTARRLLDADILFGCTDSHGSRAVLQQIAYQYMIPFIDMGVTLIAKEGSMTHVYGRVQLLAPGLACLTCSGLLDPNQVRQDMMTAFERQTDPYIQGSREPAPAVISLNGTVSSLAVTMLLAVVAGIPMQARHVLYNAITSVMRPVRATPKDDCYVCSRRGALARGESWPIFGREG
jgi:molybdopterin/thiamine biosynthesis adenylyltransferase